MPCVGSTFHKASSLDSALSLIEKVVNGRPGPVFAVTQPTSSLLFIIFLYFIHCMTGCGGLPRVFICRGLLSSLCEIRWRHFLSLDCRLRFMSAFRVQVSQVSVGQYDYSACLSYLSDVSCNGRDVFYTLRVAMLFWTPGCEHAKWLSTSVPNTTVIASRVKFVDCLYCLCIP